MTNMMLKMLLLLCFYLLFQTSLVNSQDSSPIVQLSTGAKIQGKIQNIVGGGKEEVYAYLGIKYARAERFARPQPVTLSSDDTVYDATKYGKTCYQFLLGDLDLDQTNKSEDCLYLNVWKPMNDNSGKLRPVMVWIYGGGFQSGTTATEIYDGSRLAAHGDVIVVSLNYRLGVLGFSYLGIDGAQGNQGFFDQLMALKWVKDNIESFGGDPSQVTVFGESAGSMSTSTWVLSPLAKGLLHRVIMQSATVVPQVKFLRNKQFGIEATKKFANNLGCNHNDLKQMLDCMKSKPIEEVHRIGQVSIRDMIQGEMVGPIFDDEVLPEDVARFEKGFNEVDAMFGVTRDEGSAVLEDLFPNIKNENHQFTMDEVKESIRKIMNEHFIYETDDIVQHYTKNLDVSDGNQVKTALGQMYGDFRVTCPTILFGEQLAQRSKPGQHRFYAYRFDRFHQDLTNLWFCKPWMGVCHGVDIFYMFGHSLMNDKPEDLKLSNDMIRAWTQFAKTGHPGSMDDVQWQEYYQQDSSTKPTRTMILDTKYKMIDNIFEETCTKIWAPKIASWHPNYVHIKQEL